ncbi:MAG TPA: sterol desaturase, partial [Aequorivita sp.]|nr:sterol desaturase [Aequorivita sp.]
PKHAQYGVNFGISLSVWDYLFKTDHIPHDGRDIALGFDGDENFPSKFISQELYPIKTKRRNSS